MKSSAREGVRRLDLPEFFAPLPLASVALLALNDHVLKRAFGNAVTGKLSDVAVCFMLPLFVSACLGVVTPLSLRVRLWTGAILTITAFTALEIHGPSAAAFARFLPLVARPLGIDGAVRLTEDWTDLLCLPLSFAAVAYGLRRGAAR